MKEIELSKIVAFNKLVETLKLDKLSGKETYDILKIFRKIKLISTEFDEFKQDVVNKYISTDECKENLKKSEEGNEEAKKYIDNINNEINNIIYMELISKKEVEFNPISEEVFINLLDSNKDLKVSDTMLLEDVLV